MGISFSRKCSAGNTIDGLLLAPFTVFAKAVELVASPLDEADVELIADLLGETRAALDSNAVSASCLMGDETGSFFTKISCFSSIAF